MSVPVITLFCSPHKRMTSSSMMSSPTFPMSDLIALDQCTQFCVGFSAKDWAVTVAIRIKLFWIEDGLPDEVISAEHQERLPITIRDHHPTLA